MYVMGDSNMVVLFYFILFFSFILLVFLRDEGHIAVKVL